MSLPGPGLYRLMRDVENPYPDRRSTRLSDWRNRVMWEKGDEFVVCSPPEHDSDLILELSRRANYSTIKLVYRKDGETIERLRRDAEKVRALAAALEPIPVDRPTTLLLEHDRVHGGAGGASDVLDDLFRVGRITIDDVRQALGRIATKESPP